MGLFDRRRTGFDPAQFDPVMDSPANGGYAGNMGLQVPPIGPDPYAETRPQNPGFFGKGGMGGKLLMGALGGALDGIAVYGGSKPGYVPAMNTRREEEADLKKAELLARIRADAHDGDSPYIKDAKAIGLTPGTPEFARWVTRMRSAPRIVTNDQGIYNMDTDNYGLWGGGQSGPQPGTVEDGYVFMGGDPSQPANWRKQ